MKCKKSIIPLLIVALFACMLSGCGEKEEKKQTDFVMPEGQVYVFDEFQTNDGAYFNDNGILKYRDKESKKEVIVSSEPDKTGENEKNPAYIGQMGEVFVHKDTLYAIDKDMSNAKVRIIKSDLDRSHREEIYCAEGMVQMFTYVRMGNSVYAFVSGPVAEMNKETGVQEYKGKAKSLLLQIDLKKQTVKETQLMLEGDSGEAFIMGADKEYLYYAMTEVLGGQYTTTFRRISTKEEIVDKGEEIVKVTGKRTAGSYYEDNHIIYRLMENDNSLGKIESYDMEKKTTEELKASEEINFKLDHQGREK